MGHFVTAYTVCNTSADLIMSLFWILRRAVERAYPYRAARTVFGKFLYTRLKLQDIRASELRQWFPVAWQEAVDLSKRESHATHWFSPQQLPSSVFLKLFGKYVTPSRPSKQSACPASSSSSTSCSISPDVLAKLSLKIALARVPHLR